MHSLNQFVQFNYNYPFDANYSNVDSLIDNKTTSTFLRASTNKTKSYSFSLINPIKATDPRQLSQYPISSNERSIPIKLLDSFIFKIEEVKFVLLTKTSDNTYIPARDSRIFATDSGFLELTIKFQYHSLSYYQATSLSLFLGKGITLLKSKLENNPNYEINLNSTCSNVTFLDPFIIKKEYTKVIYVEFASIYSSQSVPPEYDLIKYRPLLHSVVIGNKSNSIIFPNTETFIRFYEEGTRLREKIKIDIKQIHNNNDQKPFVILFQFEFIFIPKLESYANYSFLILKAKANDNDDNECIDDYNKQWEVITCDTYLYDEYEYIVNDCVGNTLTDCPYYYKLELYYDKWNSKCIDGYLGTSNIVLFPIKEYNNMSESDNDGMRPNQTVITRNANNISIILCSIITLIWFIVVFTMGYCSWKVYSVINKSKTDINTIEHKEEEEIEENEQNHQREESSNSQNHMLNTQRIIN